MKLHQYSLGSSKVVSLTGETKIEEIKPGDEVLTSHGLFKRVTGIQATSYLGFIYTIKTKHFNQEFTVTEDFHFISCKAYKCKSTQGFCKPDCKHAYVTRKGKRTPNCKMGHKFYSYQPQLIQNLEKGDILTFPLFKETRDKIITLFPDVHIKSRKKLPSTIGVTPELMRLFGYYMAEGCYNKRKIIFTFHQKEEHHINDVLFLCKKYFGLDGSLSYPKKKTKKSIAVVLHSTVFAAFLESLFGKLSKDKKIPDWCLFLKEEYLVELFKGWAYGDGGFKDDCFAVTTINECFAYKMRLLLSKIGIIPYTTHFFTSTKNKVYRLTISALQLKKLEDKTGIKHPNENRGYKNNKYFYIEKGMMYYPIENIKKEEYTGLIYKLDIEENIPYVLNYSTVL